MVWPLAYFDTHQGILSLTKFGGGAVLVVLPILTAGMWIILHFQWVNVSNSGPLNGQYS